LGYDVGAWAAVSAFITGRRTKWLVVILALVAGGAFLALAGNPTVSDDPASGLSSSAESSRAALAQKRLPSGQLNPALLVYERDGTLTPADRAAIAAQARALAPLAPGGALPPPRVSNDGRAATVIVPLAATGDALATVDTVRKIRAQVRTGLPDGLRVQVTGGAGFTACCLPLWSWWPCCC
jgi:RND superfamily putative drug exporter